jgi:hypothetical protein
MEHEDSYIHDHMTFVCPCIVGIIVNDDQQDETTLAYLFIPNQLYMFRAMSSSIIRSIWLYLQHLILLQAGVMDEIELIPSHPWHQPAAITVDSIRSYKCSQGFLMMGEDIARNM